VTAGTPPRRKKGAAGSSGARKAAGAVARSRPGASPPPKGAKPGPELTIVETRVYRGPNYWNYDPAIKLIVDLGVLEYFPSSTIPGFVTALLEMLPGVGQHTCGTGRVAGFTDRLNEGTWLGHVAEHVALQLQREAGTEVGRGKTRSTGEPGRYHVVYSYAEESVGVAAGRLAVRLVNHLVQAEDGFDFAAELEALILLAERSAFGPSTQAILDEASLRDIPWIRLNEASLVQLGHGVHQKRIRATMTSQTGSLGVDIAGDKKLTNRLLAATGVPVPRSEMVRSADAAAAAAKRIGFPVAMKPLDGNHGRGVMLNLTDEAVVRAAYPVARAETRSGVVVVESFLTGNDYRLLVIGGELRAVAQRVPAHVDGDGKRSVQALVDRTNLDPRRGIGHEKVLTRIKVDEESIAYAREQGFELSDAPPRGQRVYLKRTGNMSTGGISIDRTEEIHPDNAEMAELAARVVGLDIAGIDLICPDVSLPIRETGGGIVEVNAAPGFRMHTHPTEGEAQYVAKPVIDMLFPPGAPSRIPIVAVTGSNGKTTTARMIAHIMKGMGRKVGLTSTDGIYVDGRIVRKADASGPKSASMVLQNPTVDFAVFEVARGGILREGLGYQRNDVAVVLNVTGDHLGLGGINSIRQLAEVKRVIVEAVPRDGVAVLNADDPNVLAMARHTSGSVIYFSMDPEHERLKFQASRGRRAVTVEQGRNGEKIVLRHGRKSMDLVWTHLIPATFEGRARMNVQNALAATAAAWAAGAHLHDIRQGLRTFTTSYFMAPGRLNMFELDGYRVVVDYAHNPPAMIALGEFVERLSEPSAGGARAFVTGRRIGVIATAGDRRDEDIREIGRVSARYFDQIIIREDENNRGRPRGQTAELIAEGIESSSAAERRVGEVSTVLDELEATRAALDMARDGDVVVVCVDHANQVWKELQRRQHGGASESTEGLRAVVGVLDADDEVDLDL
jgi:cyanophycin synthetase